MNKMAEQGETNPWAEVEKRYSVHPEMKEYQKVWAQLSTFEEGGNIMEELRKNHRRISNYDREISRQLTGFKGTVEDITIPAAHLPNGIPATLYKPELIPEVPVIVIYLRGGGLIALDIGAYGDCIMSLTKLTNAIIIAPEYRNLPCDEDRFAPFNDTETAARWVLDNKTAIGGVASSPVGVAGDSAGGQLTCSLTYMCPGRLDFQILVYPLTDINMEVESVKEFWDIPAFNSQGLELCLKECKLYEEPSQANNPRVNPSAPRGTHDVTDPPLSASPPTLIILAELDPLRDYGISYADKLRAAGVDTQLHVVNGVVHGFFAMVSTFKTKAIEGQKLMADFLKPYQSKQA